MKDWNGTFEAWSVDSATGSITHEQGTMQGGVLTGDYTCDVHTGEGALDVYSLWSNRRVWNISLTREVLIPKEDPDRAALRRNQEKTAGGNRLYGSDPLCL